MIGHNMHNHTHEEFTEALKTVLSEQDFRAVWKARFDINEKCILVAKNKFIGKLKSEDEESLAIIRDVMIELSETGMHGLTYGNKV